MIESLHGQSLPLQQAATPRPQTAQTKSFQASFQQELDKAKQEEREVAFSKHAISRAEERGIEITQSLLDQLKGSMLLAQAKGAKNVLAMDSEKAFLINVPNAKVITAITPAEMKENIFTNIDGAVFL